MYAKFLKRAMDIFLALLALALLWPLLLALTAVGGIALGGNPFFTQLRPGKKGSDGRERIFRLIKFRSMSDRRDGQGNLLPDETRLTKYGKFLRASSLDELPELVNILKGDMSFVGPRPQLVRDLVFMSYDQRRRHNIRPGLTGLAQISGRNAIGWEEKLDLDLQYVDGGITFWGDVQILLGTVKQVLKAEGVVREGTASDLDFGDWLLRKGKIDRFTYEQKLARVGQLLGGRP